MPKLSCGLNGVDNQALRCMHWLRFDTWVAKIYRVAELHCNETVFSPLLKGQSTKHPVLVFGQHEQWLSVVHTEYISCHRSIILWLTGLKSYVWHNGETGDSAEG